MTTNKLNQKIIILLLLLVCFFSINTLTANVDIITTGLVLNANGQYSGSTLIDQTSNHNNGTMINTETGMTPNGRPYVTFSSANKSIISIPNSASINISGQPFWFEWQGTIDAFTSYEILAHKYDGSNGGWYLTTTGSSPYNKIRFGVVGTDKLLYYYNSNIPLTAGQPVQVDAVYDGSVMHIYVNAVESTTPQVVNKPLLGSSVPLRIGSDNYVGSFTNLTGKCYSMKLYSNYTPTLDDIQQNYADLRHTYFANDILRNTYAYNGVPSYMGDIAIQKTSNGVSLISNDYYPMANISVPYYQDNGGSKTDCNLNLVSANGIRYKDCYATGSTINLTYTGDNREISQEVFLGDNKLKIDQLVIYTSTSLVVKDGFNISGLNDTQYQVNGPYTISPVSTGGELAIMSDDATIQGNMIYNSTGSVVYTNFQKRNEGSVRSTNAEIFLSAPKLTPMLAPSGKLGTFIIAEHADWTTTDSIKAIAYGTNDTNSTDYGKKGLIGHGINATWSVFAKTRTGEEGIETPAFKTVTDDMYAHGFEITPHTVEGAAGNDVPNRTVTAYYLPWYTGNYSNTNYIGHGLGLGARNSDPKSLGYDQTSQYYVMDLFKNNGITNMWAFQDFSATTNNINIVLTPTGGQYVGLPRYIVWQNTNLNLSDGTPVYQWKSQEVNNTIALNYWNNATMNSLIDTYGISIWHCYLADNEAAYDGVYFTKGTPTTINSGFDGFLTYVGGCISGGDLWNPTASQYIAYYKQISNVTITCTGKNQYTITNDNPTTINGYALRFTGIGTPTLDGTAMHTKIHGTETIMWADLTPGSHTLVI